MDTFGYNIGNKNKLSKFILIGHYLIGLIEDEKRKNMTELKLHITNNQNIEELRAELRNFDWNKYSRYQPMTVEEMIDCDENVDCCKDFTTKDIFDIVTEKKIQEEIVDDVNNEVIKVSSKEANKAIETLLNCQKLKIENFARLFQLRILKAIFEITLNFFPGLAS